MTSTSSSWSGVNRVVVAHEAEGEYFDYYIDMSAHSGWKGEITGIRFDPNTTAGSFEISTIEFLNFKPVPDTVPHVFVNGTELEFVFEPALTNDGDIAVVAEPKRGFFSSLRLYYEYTRFEGEGKLTVKTNGVNLSRVIIEYTTTDGSAVRIDTTYTYNSVTLVFPESAE
jgi:hypothetical protein